MKKEVEIVQKIGKQYVSNDCIQVMIPYRDAMTLLNQNGILFHSKTGSNLYINEYLHDQRRKRFPYSNIPTHYSRVGFKKYSSVNQLLEFEKPYICVRDGFISESFAIKDNNQALLIEKVMRGSKTTTYMTYDEILNFLNKSNDNEQVYYVYIDGSMPNLDYPIFPSKEKIYTHIQMTLAKNVKDFREYRQNFPETQMGEYLANNPLFLNYMEATIKNLDLSLVDFNIGIENSSNLLIVRVNNGNITIQGVIVVFVHEDDFKVDIYDIPVTKFTLEQLKYVTKINLAREPKIPLRLNPSVTRDDIKEAKQMVRALKK